MILIRTAAKKDLISAAKAYFLAFRHKNTSEYWTMSTAKAFLSWSALRQPDLFFLAKHGSAVIGGVFAEIKPWWDGNRLVNLELFLIPAYQRKGIGRRLLRYILKKSFLKYRIVAIEATVLCEDSFPSEWYKRLGFNVPRNILFIFGDVRIVFRKLRISCSRH